MGSRSLRKPADQSRHVATIFIIRPDGQEPREIRQLAEAVESRANELMMLVKVRRSREDRVSGADESERPLWLLTPKDANDVYSAAHQDRVCIATFRASYVRRDPSTTPARRRDLIELPSYIRYKAFCGRAWAHRTSDDSLTTSPSGQQQRRVKGTPTRGHCHSMYSTPRWSGSS